MNSDDTWVGIQINKHLIGDQLADGTYSRVYEGRNHFENETHVFKVAKQKNIATSQSFANPFATRALAIMERGIAPVRPNANFLLRTQYAHLASKSNSSWPAVLEIADREGDFFYSMESIPGVTLRQKMSETQVTLDSLTSLCEALQSITTAPVNNFHGDLKPENILCAGDIMRPIDPGHFGAGECIESNDLNLAVTTPVYYPFLKPDDLFAFGLIVWEIALKFHPLLMSRGGAETSKLGASVKEWVDQSENTGQYFLSSILNVERPAESNPNIGAEFEEVLLKAIRLAVSPSGTIERDPGYKDFAEWMTVLKKLKSLGIRF